MKISKIIAMCAAIMLMAATQACSDDNNPAPLPDGAGVMENGDYNTLSFSWDKVPGAVQYSYQLYKSASPDTIITTAVTNVTEASFSGLLPSTEYTLKVVAYPAIGSGQAIGNPIYITARTSDIIQLETPVVEFNQDLTTLILTWQEVENAESYYYVINDEDGNAVTSGTVKTNSVEISNFTVGTYQAKVWAMTTKGGYDYSEPGVCDFEFENAHIEIWRTQGTYTSSVTGRSWKATLVAYQDETYSIEGWYGVAGYDLNFGIDMSYPDDYFWISDEYDYDGSSYSYKVPTGLTTSPKNLYVYPWWNACTFEGDANKGKIEINVYNDAAGAWTNDTFVWGDNAMDLNGLWTVTQSCQTALESDDWSWEASSFSYTGSVSVTGTTITLPGLYFDDETLTGTIDWDALTITIPPTDVWTWYVFAGADSQTSNVVGTISADGKTITINDWCAWYDGYEYVYQGKATLTRQ